jgi:hypothetical protein
MQLSRRDFLKICGITISAGALADVGGLFNGWSPNVAYARTFAVTPVHLAPNGAVVGRLFPDSVVQLASHDGAWLRTEHGYILRHAVQPMPTWGMSNPFPTVLPSLIEVNAPVALIYMRCDDTAAPIARIGHGGVMQVFDYLRDEGAGWFAVAHADGSQFGWTRAERWSEITLSNASALIDSITVESATQRLIAAADKEVLATFDVSAFSTLERGEYHLMVKQPSAQVGNYSGAAWTSQWTGGLHINGAYWHNQFGQPNSAEQVELSPLAAQWLYQHLADSAMLHVV